MSNVKISKLKNIKDFSGLIEYLRDELDWPIEVEDAEDITFDYEPKELGIEGKYVAKINIIKQIRPLVDNQPWGLFYIEFESKHLPVVVLRRILRALIHSRRSASDRMKIWDLTDLIFISTLGEDVERKISFAHFTESDESLPVLRTFSWDPTDTYFHYLQTKLDLEKLNWPEDENNVKLWREKWSSAFKLKHREVIRTSKQLAILMAHSAVQIREQVKVIFKFEVKDGPLHKLFNNFKKTLMHDLKINNFADMYAQTIAYGLFSARVSHEGKFAMDDIGALIPNTNPFLKNLFTEFTKIGEQNFDRIGLEELGIRELILLLKESNIEAVLSDFGKQKKGEDPVIHFYELFLKEYDADQKVKKGVFYTPDAVVSFIVKSIQIILKERFNFLDGLADNSITSRNGKKWFNVLILDPATGTGTFLKYVLKEIREEFVKNNPSLSKADLNKNWNEFVDKYLLSRIFGFELMMAPYAVAHLKLGLLLKETGCKIESDKRLGVFLTNTLEGTHAGSGTLDSYLNWLADEVDSANKIKMKPLTVILGNPPYSSSSENKSVFIDDLMEDYKKDVKHEKKYGVLEDDYVKFIRLAHWKIDQCDFGLFGYITNNSYLTGVIHRGMRKSLLDAFDEIYILNLHGSSRIGEKTPDGGKDENVFDIQQGVSIGIFIKNKIPLEEKIVNYADLWGLREEKYKFLFNNNIKTIDWITIKPITPYYFFIPKDFSFQDEYNKYLSIKEIFKNSISGVETSHDKFAVAFTKKEILERMAIFTSKNPNERVSELLKIKNLRDWKINEARELARQKNLKDLVVPYAYRPFDNRWTCYDSSIVVWEKRQVMQNLLEENIALVTTRMLSTKKYQHVFVTANIGDRCLVSIKTRETGYYFPLYIYEDQTKKKPNFSDEFLKIIKKRYEQLFTPEEIFNYIYAILNSKSFRDRYNEFLKIEYAKIPITSKETLFKKLSDLGNQLITLHLGRLPKFKDLIGSFRGDGDNIIGKNSYRDNKIKINSTQMFEGITVDIYNYTIGSYAVCQKWLKDREGRKLSGENIEEFRKIVTILKESIRITKEIDNIIMEFGGWPIN